MHARLFITLKMEDLVLKRSAVGVLANANKEDSINLHAILTNFIFEHTLKVLGQP